MAIFDFYWDFFCMVYRGFVEAKDLGDFLIILAKCFFMCIWAIFLPCALIYKFLERTGLLSPAENIFRNIKVFLWKLLLAPFRGLIFMVHTAPKRRTRKKERALQKKKRELSKHDRETFVRDPAVREMQSTLDSLSPEIVSSFGQRIEEQFSIHTPRYSSLFEGVNVIFKKSGGDSSIDDILKVYTPWEDSYSDFLRFKSDHLLEDHNINAWRSGLSEGTNQDWYKACRKAGFDPKEEPLTPSIFMEKIVGIFLEHKSPFKEREQKLKNELATKKRAIKNAEEEVLSQFDFEELDLKTELEELELEWLELKKIGKAKRQSLNVDSI